MGGVGDGRGFYCCQLHVNMQFNRLSCFCCTATGISKRRARKEVYICELEIKELGKKKRHTALPKKEKRLPRLECPFLVKYIQRKSW